MLCYKDITFCAAKDCANSECIRNQRGPEFRPDDFWKDHVAVSPFQNKCDDYKKDNEK